MNEIIKNAVILFVITLIASVILAFTSSLTLEPIKEQQILKRDQALQSVIKDATFEEMQSLDFTNYSKITSIYEAKNGDQKVGYAFNVTTTEGYGGPIILMVGISIDGLVTGVEIIKQTETPGLGTLADEEPFKSQFKDIPAEMLTVKKTAPASNLEIAAISGATITSKAVTNAANEAIAYFNEQLKEAK